MFSGTRRLQDDTRPRLTAVASLGSSTSAASVAPLPLSAAHAGARFTYWGGHASYAIQSCGGKEVYGPQAVIM